MHGFLSSCGAHVAEYVGSVVVAGGLSCSEARRILVPHSGIEPMSLALEGKFLTRWTTKELPQCAVNDLTNTIGLPSSNREKSFLISFILLIFIHHLQSDWHCAG